MVNINKQGDYDGSTNLYPTTGGSGQGGEVMIGDEFYLSVEGTFKGNLMPVGTKLLALANNPMQDDTKWGFEIPNALDSNGNIILATGWVTNAKYYTIMIGYNAFSAVVSINYFAYLQMADREGLTII